MSILTYENATVEQLNMAIQCLKRRGDPIDEDSVRSFFAKLSGIDAEDSGAVREALTPKRRWHSYCPKEERRYRRGNRPEERKVAPWYGTVARIMADGTPLKRALRIAGVTLTATEIRQLYYRKEFRAMYQAERHLYQMERQRRLDPEEREAMREHFIRVFGGANVGWVEGKRGDSRFFGPKSGNFE